MAQTRRLAPPPAAPPAPVPQRRSRRWLTLPLALAALLSLVLGLFIVRSLGTTTPQVAQTEQAAPATASPAPVPDVVGVPLQDALAQLQQAGFTPVTGASVESDQAAGTIVRVEPAPGQVLAPGSDVVVYESAGAASSAVGGSTSDAPPSANVPQGPTDPPLPSASAAAPTSTVAPPTATPTSTLTPTESPTSVPTPPTSTAAGAGAPTPDAETATAAVPGTGTLTDTPPVTSTASAPGTSATTLSDGSRRIENAAQGFALTLPAGWDVIDPQAPQLTPAVQDALTQSGFAGLAANPDALQQAGVLFFALHVTPPAGITPGTNVNLLQAITTPTPLDAFIGDLVQRLQASQVVDGPIAQRRVTLDSGVAEELRYRVRQPTATGPAIITTQYVFDQDRRNYVLTFSTREDQVDTYAPVFEQIAQSFAVLPDEAP